MCYFRFKRQFPIVASEAGGYYSDVLCVKGTEIVEVEVKVDRSDFEADFKKDKHRNYRNDDTENKWRFHPDKFYFAVPEEMKDYCLKRIKEECPEYGLIVIGEPKKDYWGQYEFPIRVVKPCRKFKKSVRDDKIFEENKEVINARVSSQLCGLLQKQQRKLFEKLEKEEKDG